MYSTLSKWKLKTPQNLWLTNQGRKVKLHWLSQKCKTKARVSGLYFTMKVYKSIYIEPKKRKSTPKKKMILLNLDGCDCIKVVFPFCVKYLNEVRNIHGRKWHEDLKFWTIPLTFQKYKDLESLGYCANTDLRKWAKQQAYAECVPDLDLPGFVGALLPYQIEGVRMLNKFDGCALLADEMGLGKTIQAIAYLAHKPEMRPALIVCPAYLKQNWKNEFLKFLPNQTIQILEGGSGTHIHPSDIVIIGYNVLSNKFEETGKEDPKTGKIIWEEIPYTGWIDFLIDYGFKVVVADEGHYFKNDTALLTKAMMKLKTKINKKIVLTGTPIENRTMDIYNPVNFINSKIFPNKWQFGHTFCDAQNNGYGWKFDGASNTEKLYRILYEKVLIRRLKDDVLKDLPSKIYSVISLPLDNIKEYTEAEVNFRRFLRGKLREDIEKAISGYADVVNIDRKEINKKAKQKDNPLFQLTTLKELSVKGKLKSIIEWVHSFLLTSHDKKIVLFCEHRFVMDAIYAKFKKVTVCINGDVPMSKRQNIVDSFQSNKQIRIFIGNKAAQEGITLTAANVVGILELPWTPGSLNQRIDRVHRIGLKHSVNVYYFLTENTIDTKLAAILDVKSDINKAILEGKELNTSSVLADLINSYKTENNEKPIK